MIRSILICLTSESSHSILEALGRAVQAWFLEQITISNVSLASKLHDEQGLKPYTVSTLLNEHAHPIRTGLMLLSGERCFLRITTLNEELSELIVRRFIHHIPKKLTLYKMGFRVDGVYTRHFEHQWAGKDSFSDIVQDATITKSRNPVRMEFISPTVFRSNGVDTHLPEPGRIFRSLFEKWNFFAPEPLQLHDQWPQFAKECIVVDKMTSMNTVNWKIAEVSRSLATGFTGTISFNLLSKNKIKREWQQYWDSAYAVMQALAKFAFYSGVGHRTTIGMGQVRNLPVLSKE